MANILGINISDLSAADALKKIVGFLADGRQHYVVTPNPEIILAAGEDEELFYILNKADLSLADGFGIKIAGFFSRQKIYRITGADMTLRLLEAPEFAKRRILILNWNHGLSTAEMIKKELGKRYPDREFLVLDVERENKLTAFEIETIKSWKPEIMFVTLGLGWQEKLMYHNLPLLPSVKVSLGVGGSFDFITGRARRAPRLFRSLGLEWLFRLFVSLGQGKVARGRRIWRAVFVFTAKAFRACFINPFLFRQNVAIIIYRLTATEPEILIVEREDQPGHWQLPQGGRDGQDLETAGRREAAEELGLGENDLELKATFPDVYHYEFAKRDNLALNDPHRHFHYKGQSQGLFVARFLGADSRVRLEFWDHRAWKWVSRSNLMSAVDPVRRAGVERFLEKFDTLSL